VLVRIRKLPSGKQDMEYEEPQEYKAGGYITNYHDCSDLEKDLMSERVLEPSSLVKDFVVSWRATEGVKTEIVTTTE
jgi:hypothetical protein